MKLNTLIIGGTRHIGYYLAKRLHEAGHRVTLLNRGISRDDLPSDLPRLRCDRTDSQQLRRTLTGRNFDVVIDCVVFNGAEAEAISHLLRGQVKHYIFISTGQVYLVRDRLQRPFAEADYAGSLLPMPEPLTFDHTEYMYGYDKRHAEDVFAAAYADAGFPYTSLRLPMVNGQRDTHQRLYNYILRLRDGSPILVPDTPNHKLRHVYVGDVVTAVERVIGLGREAHGKVFNISQDESLTLEAFLGIVGAAMDITPQLLQVERAILDSETLLPNCSPFSERWMSELDNSLSKAMLDLAYTPPTTYLPQLVEHYLKTSQPIPAGYKRRAAERKLAAELMNTQPLL